MIAMHQPAISVCIPTYNSEKFISAAISSVLEQDFSEFELIVVDNNSNDNTISIVQEFSKNDKRVILYRNEKNLGMVGNFNRCLDYSRGKYIKFLCSDDVFLQRNALARYLYLAEKVDGVALVASARNTIDHSGELLRTVSEYSGVFWCNGMQIINDCLLTTRNKIGEPTSVMFPRNLVTRGFDPRFKQILDLEFWFYLLGKGCFVYTDEPLVGFRRHAEQTTKLNYTSCEHINDIPILYEAYLDLSSLGYGAKEKEYLWNSYCRSLWKLYKKNKIPKNIFFEVVKKHSNVIKFFFSLPFYSIVKKKIRSGISITMNKID